VFRQMFLVVCTELLLRATAAAHRVIERPTSTITPTSAAIAQRQVKIAKHLPQSGPSSGAG